MNSLDFLDIAIVNTQVGILPYVLPEEKKMKHKLTEALKIDQFRSNVRIPMPMTFVLPLPPIRIEELNIKPEETMFVNQWDLYKGGHVWPPVQEETEEPEEPVTPEPETPETPVTPETPETPVTP
jgi:hypothetical protein